jgi:hypothetical protein
LNSVLNKSRGDSFGKKKRLEEKRKKKAFRDSGITGVVQDWGRRKGRV